MVFRQLFPVVEILGFFQCQDDDLDLDFYHSHWPLMREYSYDNYYDDDDDYYGAGGAYYDKYGHG